MGRSWVFRKDDATVDYSSMSRWRVAINFGVSWFPFPLSFDRKMAKTPFKLMSNSRASQLQEKGLVIKSKQKNTQETRIQLEAWKRGRKNTRKQQQIDTGPFRHLLLHPVAWFGLQRSPGKECQLELLASKANYTLEIPLSQRVVQHTRCIWKHDLCHSKPTCLSSF